MNDYPSPLGQLSREAVFSPAEAVSPGDLIRIADIVNLLRGVTVSVGDREVTQKAITDAMILYNELLESKDHIESLEELSASDQKALLERTARHKYYGKATTEDDVERYIHGEVSKKAGAKIDEFTPADASVWVNDIARDFASG